MNKMKKEELKQYLIEEVGMSQSSVNGMSAFELINAWLKYNGIVGYTEEIINVIQAATGTTISEETLYR